MFSGVPTHFQHSLAESEPAPAPERFTLQLMQSHVSPDVSRAISLSHAFSCMFQRLEAAPSSLTSRNASAPLCSSRSAARLSCSPTTAMPVTCTAPPACIRPLRAYYVCTALRSILCINNTTSRCSVSHSAYTPPFSAPLARPDVSRTDRGCTFTTAVLRFPIIRACRCTPCRCGSLDGVGFHGNGPCRGDHMGPKSATWALKRGIAQCGCQQCLWERRRAADHVAELEAHPPPHSPFTHLATSLLGVVPCTRRYAGAGLLSR